MNTLIESLNVCGARFLDFAWPMLWQSSLLIAIVFVFDLLLLRKIRSAIRYALWFVVLVKLLLPPTLALPTGIGWWLRVHEGPPPPIRTRTVSVSYGDPTVPMVPTPLITAPALPPQPKLSRDAWLVLGSGFASAFLFTWLLFRWRQITRCVRETTAPSRAILEALADAQRSSGLRKAVALRITSRAMSPAVCGLFRPVVLLPQSLVETLSTEQLRAVLLHELIHLRRCDVWTNCAQTLLQILYWWHPLLWIANARIRRVREEAVDDAVMLALNNDADVYAPTLLEVAKLAFNRPLASLGLVGILESRNSLRQRIERLVNFTTPGRAGLSVVSILAIAIFSAIAVPMGEAPADSGPASQSSGERVPFPRSRVRQLAANTVPETNIAAAPVPNIYARSNTLYRNTARQALYKKLNDIKFDKVSYPGMLLSEVVQNLATETQRRDPEQKGLNFLISKAKAPPNSPRPTFDRTTGAPIEPMIAIDPQTGLPMPYDEIDLASVKIDLPELTKVRLMDVLEAIVKTADHRIKYAILDYGIEFSFHGPDVPELHVRTFKVDPNTFYNGLQNVGTLSFSTVGNGDGIRVAEIHTVVIKFFKAVGVDLTAPKSVYFNERQGTLAVHASLDDLDLIEAALNTLNVVPPQVTIKARFVEVDPAKAAALNTNFPPTNVAAPGNIQMPFAILTDPQFSILLRAIKDRDGMDLVNEGQVTTLSGRQAQFQVVDVQEIVNGTQTNHVERTLDVVPYVCADGYTIQLTLIPTVAEIVEWNNPSNFVRTVQIPGNPPIQSVLPLPRGRVHQVTNSCIVWDGQTVVLGGFAGRADRIQNKNLLIFVTPTIIDPSGNRKNSDDELPFARTNIPPQATIK